MQNGCDTSWFFTGFTGSNSLDRSIIRYLGVPCKGDSTGMIVSQATGSQGPYRYYWFDPQGR